MTVVMVRADDGMLNETGYTPPSIQLRFELPGAVEHGGVIHTPASHPLVCRQGKTATIDLVPGRWDVDGLAGPARKISILVPESGPVDLKDLVAFEEERP